MKTSECLHPALRSLLEFEEQRLGLPLHVQRKDLAEEIPARFRPVVELVLHAGYRYETFDVLLNNDRYQLRAPVAMWDDEQQYGFLDRRNELHPLAGVTGNRVHVYYDLEWLFRHPQALQPVQPPWDIRSLSRLNLLADVTLAAALARAARNIRHYDWKEERQLYLFCTTGAREKLARDWQQNIAANERSLQDKLWEVRQLVQKNRDLHDRLRLYEQLTRRAMERKATEDHSNLVRMLGKGLTDLQVDERELRAFTDHIEVCWNGVDYDLGKFEIRIPLQEGTLLIHQKNPDRIVDGFPHPHVNSQGVPCLGNITGTVGELMGEAQYFQLVTLLLEFLRSYNEDYPYLRIEHWDPDWEDEDEDRFDQCYRNASLSECAACSDWDCHFREGAQRRCFENTDTMDCIECSDCDLSSEATEDCRNNHAASECVSCTRDCAFAGDEYACFDSHEGADCPTCTHNQCSYHGDHHETECRTGQAVSSA